MLNLLAPLTPERAARQVMFSDRFQNFLQG
jgi:hypothetical protein